MALQQTVILANSLTVPDAYIRIDTISGHKGTLTLSVNKYISREAFHEGAPYLEPTELVNFIPDTTQGAKEIFTQGYEHLKSIRYYQAIDILED